MCVCIYNHHLILSKIVCIQSPPYTTITLNSGNSCDFNEMISNIYKITFYHHIVNPIIEYFNALLYIKVFFNYSLFNESLILFCCKSFIYNHF